LPAAFGGSDRAYPMPISTQDVRSSSVARLSAPTRIHPSISRPCMTATVAAVVATSSADWSGWQ
jgi:hypothetical protein